MNTLEVILKKHGGSLKARDKNRTHHARPNQG